MNKYLKSKSRAFYLIQCFRPGGEDGLGVDIEKEVASIIGEHRKPVFHGPDIYASQLTLVSFVRRMSEGEAPLVELERKLKEAGLDFDHVDDFAYLEMFFDEQ